MASFAVVCLTSVWIGLAGLPVIADDAADAEPKEATSATEAGMDSLFAAAEEEKGDAAGDELTGPAASGPGYPAPMHCGMLQKVTRQALFVNWVDLDAVLLRKEFDAPDTPDKETVVTRDPAEGMVYAILAVDVVAGRSLSVYDYVLNVGGDEQKCLAIAPESRPYDARRLVVTSPGRTTMLFEAPESATEFTVTCAVATRIRLPDITISAFGAPVTGTEEEPLQEPAAETSDEKEQKPEANDPVADDAGDGE